MALKPPPIGDVLRQLNELIGDSALRTEADKNARALLQSALRRLDMVSREEFDAQADILARTRARVEELEQQLASLEAELAPRGSNPAQQGPEQEP
jgi:BMFP domain-containing protein YqiC